MKRFRAVVVEWDDAFNSEDTDWLAESRIDPDELERPMRIKSAGLLYRKTKRVVVLAQSMHRRNSQEANVQGLLTIPRVCIRSIKRIWGKRK